MFADDVANCAETAIKLQQQINIVDQFCTDTGMEINLDKTEITVFRNGGPSGDMNLGSSADNNLTLLLYTSTWGYC